MITLPHEVFKMPQGNTLVSKDKQTSIFQELNITMACVWNAKQGAMTFC